MFKVTHFYGQISSVFLGVCVWGWGGGLGLDQGFLALALLTLGPEHSLSCGVILCAMVSLASLGLPRARCQ